MHSSNSTVCTRPQGSVTRILTCVITRRVVPAAAAPGRVGPRHQAGSRSQPGSVADASTVVSGACDITCCTT